LIKVGIVCGGASSEHEISCISAGGVLGAIDRNKYQPQLIGITKSGKWVLPPDNYNLKIDGSNLPVISEELPETDIDNLKVDVLFPVLHGTYGEDGGFQKDAENAGIKYVGSGIDASANGMDKSISKIIFKSNGLEVAPGIVATRDVWVKSPEKILEASKPFGFPLFVKPAKSGSSRGTSKVKNASELSRAIDFAFEYDDKAMIETAIVGREIECAVLQKDGEVLASPLGEIKVLGDHEFYDFEAKYLDGSTQLVIPADLPSSDSNKIQELAKTAFKALECSGLARVDFFYSDGKIIINEINTMPGFTSTSMFPRMWAQGGIAYKDLISTLIEGALAKN
jgi:D-alanine-D-alanine ligase